MNRIWQLRSWLFATLLALSVLRCGSNVEPTTATDIAGVSGDGQSGTVGQVLPDPLVVRVTDANNNAVPGQTVQWEAQGGGSVSAGSVETNSDGLASVQRILGPTPGDQTTAATVSGLNGSPVTFVSTAVGGGPATIVITTNPPVAALTSEVFDPSVQPVVTVTDGSGNPTADQQVTASIASGGGTLEGETTATTDASGVARFTDLGISGSGDNTIEFRAGDASVTSSPVSVSALPTEATDGKWSPVVNWDIVPLHMSLLPNGKIFAWGRAEPSAVGADTMGMPRIWDPSAGGAPSGLPEIHVADMLFCAGHTLMPDGRLMVNGGHHMDAAGIKTTYFFSENGAPTKAQDMAHGRWYPTLTVLPDGNVLTMAGQNELKQVVTTPELWNGTEWRELTGAGARALPYYPRNFVDPVKDGQVFYAGEQVTSRWFDYRGNGSWTTGPRHIWPFNREYGSAVMYDTGKILYVGGGGDQQWNCSCPAAERAASPTATAEKIDLTQANPQWQSTGSMSEPRRHMNATILPDGQVLATGGTKGGGFVDINVGDAVRAAEVWNPATGDWTTLAHSDRMRVYHSVSLLLPDGTVLHGASGDAMAGDGVTEVPRERTHEIFSPPYLFKGARPTITSAPNTVGYLQTFSVETPNAAQITDVRWIRLASVTHAFDASARANTLSFTVGNGSIEVAAPDSPKLAPPGHYLLFILNRNGVPSVGKVVRVQ